MSYIPQGQPDRRQNVRDIVDKLKKQGLFDQFRKECLADVDTKPAYQNLRHKVENTVARFLSGQTWRTDINKNALRESLRRHITESQMLSSGIDRVVEQVVNPKIYTEFKCKLDEAVCELMGMDYNGWLEKLRTKEELEQQIKHLEQERKYREEMEKHNPHKIPHLMEVPVYNESNPGLMPNQDELQAPMIPPPNMMPGAVGMPPGFNPAVPGGFPQFPPTEAGFPGMYGFPQSGVPLDPNTPGIPQAWANALAMTQQLEQKKAETAGVALNLPHNPTLYDILNPMLNPMMHPPGREKEDLKAHKKKKKEIEPLTVESFLNIPLPKNEPPKPKDHKKGSKSELVVMGTDDKDVEVEIEAVPDHVQGIVLPEAQDENSQKVYQFAWDNVDEDNASEMTISSVHTSDLSEFDEEEVEEWSAPVSAAEEEVEESEEEVVEEKREEEESADSLDETQSPVSSPVKELASTPTKPKPRKLLSLSYNYSDSDDDETREERKARIATEKEERYLRRQQRRAELELKRSQREARLKQEKTKSAEMKEKEEDEETIETEVIEESQIEVTDTQYEVTEVIDSQDVAEAQVQEVAEVQEVVDAKVQEVVDAKEGQTIAEPQEIVDAALEPEPLEKDLLKPTTAEDIPMESQEAETTEPPPPSEPDISTEEPTKPVEPESEISTDGKETIHYDEEKVSLEEENVSVIEETVTTEKDISSAISSTELDTSKDEIVIDEEAKRKLARALRSSDSSDQKSPVSSPVKPMSPRKKKKVPTATLR